MDETLKLPYLSKADQRGDFQVWIVDGGYIRGHTDELHDALAAEGWA